MGELLSQAADNRGRVHRESGLFGQFADRSGLGGFARLDPALRDLGSLVGVVEHEELGSIGPPEHTGERSRLAVAGESVRHEWQAI